MGFNVFLFGLIVGSFLNVVIYRYNTGMTLGGRSMCFSCGKTLQWYELFPLFSFVVQRGKCWKCKSHISWQYPLVEFITGLLFLGSYIVAENIVHFIYLLISMSLLMVISVYDFRHKIIPDLFAFLFAGFALIYTVYLFIISGNSEMFLKYFLAGPLYFTPFAALWYFSKGKWMGFGDAKLAIGMGWFLGIENTYIAMLIAFWTGAIVGLILVAKAKIQQLSQHWWQRWWNGRYMSVTLKSEIPFGPFLILGLLAVTFFGSAIHGIIQQFFLVGM
jgi:leader peptidase (prepilin peptidase)/N-methyltransferase